jgi:hypothetical protein
MNGHGRRQIRIRSRVLGPPLHASFHTPATVQRTGCSNTNEKGGRPGLRRRTTSVVRDTYDRVRARGGSLKSPSMITHYTSAVQHLILIDWIGEATSCSVDRLFQTRRRTSARDHGRPANDMHTSRSIFLIRYVRRAVHASSAQPHPCAGRRRRLQCVDPPLGELRSCRPVAVDRRQPHPETHTEARPAPARGSGPRASQSPSLRFSAHACTSFSERHLAQCKCMHVQEHRAASCSLSTAGAYSVVATGEQWTAVCALGLDVAMAGRPSVPQIKRRWYIVQRLHQADE